ncbi:MAG: hypothetical protein K8S27_13535 [Candidatus Omnitrophica bacterium]|nr:hypothetical protein [Candidatus Omnitrophota bacterium]
MKKRFKVFVTDGEKIQQIFFINQTEAGDFYFGLTIKGLNSKFSRHQSGKTHLKVEDNRHDLYESQKISEFRGIEHLPDFAITKDVLERLESGILYNGKKFDGSVFIDLRMYNNSIFVSPFLLEPDKMQMLANLIESLLKNLQIIIFTQTEPWIVLTVYER